MGMVYVIKDNGICHVAASLSARRMLCGMPWYSGERTDGYTSTGIAADCTTCKSIAMGTTT